jgi:hypothetical protein
MKNALSKKGRFILRWIEPEGIAVLPGFILSETAGVTAKPFSALP